jgi:hypothetical protein
MPDNIPGTKKKFGKKQLLIVGLGGLGAIGVWLWYRKTHGTAPSTSTDTTGSGYGAGTDPNAIDPNTGVPYSQEYGYGQSYGGGGWGGGGGGWPVSTGGGSTTTTQTVTTNAQWAQASEEYLSHLGYNKLAVALALGKYLSGQPLDNNQVGIVEAAIGFEGQPPQGAPKIIRSGGGGGTGQHKVITITLSRPETVDEIAKQHGMTRRQLLFLNPNLVRYVKTITMQSFSLVPKGTRVRVWS